jgi:hypothetical protein
MIEFVLILSAFLIALAVLAGVSDSLERRDARRRNQPTRRYK